MTTPASHALAVSFAHVGTATDFSIVFASGTSPVTGTLATGTYRMWLAPSASDALRLLADAMKLAIAAARVSSPVVVASLSADGVASFAFSGDVPTSVTFAAPLWRALGMAAAATTLVANAVTGARPVWYLALMAGATGPYWQARQSGGSEETPGGDVYTFAATVTSWARTLEADAQPTTPALRASLGCDATALYPAEEYMGATGSTATAREWSVLDVLVAARNAACGYTGDWPTARTSTTAPVWRVRVGKRASLSLETTPLRPEWLAYCRWSLDLVSPSATPTETRA